MRSMQTGPPCMLKHLGLKEQKFPYLQRKEGGQLRGLLLPIPRSSAGAAMLLDTSSGRRLLLEIPLTSSWDELPHASGLNWYWVPYLSHEKSMGCHAKACRWRPRILRYLHTDVIHQQTVEELAMALRNDVSFSTCVVQQTSSFYYPLSGTSKM